jgi:uncharacterized damage-inducible protein DinB
MTQREFYLERRRAEHPVFMRVLQSIPADQVAYKPHERSPSTAQVVWTLANELRSCVEAATEFRTMWHSDPAPSLPEMLSLYEQRANTLTDAVQAMDDDAWNRVAQFYYRERLVSEQPVGQFLWYIHFDAIHHRGQLSAYLRPMGATVPAIYGPSADSRGSA